MTREYYQTHRAEILARAKERHNANKSLTYKRLIQVRKDIYRLKESISNFRTRISKLQKRIWNLERSKEFLEMKYGKERSNVKRTKANVV